MASATPEAPTYAARHTAASLDVPLAWLVPNVFNPRRTFDEGALDELAESLQAHGMLEPIVVREVQWPETARVTDASGRTVPCYEVIAGERRLRAAHRAGLETVPVRVLQGVDDAQALQLCVIENLQRQDLDPIEQALGYKALHEVAGLSQTQIAAAVKRSQPTIARSIGLLKLPEDVQTLVREGQLSASHGEALLHYHKFPGLCSTIAAVAVEDRWTLKRIADKPHTDWRITQHATKVVQRIWAGGNEIDTAVCKDCPFGAFRTDGSGDGGFCLKPEHYQELRAAAKATQAAALVALAAEKAAGGETLLDLRTVPHDTATDLRIYNRPEACTDACPCHVSAIDRWGNPTHACTDPKRFEQLRQKADRAKTSARNGLMRARHAEALRRVDAVTLREVPGEPGIRELALIVSVALERGARHKARELAGQRAGHASEVTARDALARMSADQLVRYACDALLTSNMLDGTDNSYADAGLLNWYVGGWEPKQQQEQADGD